MSQRIENLSALIDGEELTPSSSAQSLHETLKSDRELEQKWQSYHLIRDGLRKELPAELNFDIADQVAKALEAEPVILAPKKTWRDLPLVGSVVPFAKQGGQMAIAASVAVAMIIGVQQFNQSGADQPFNAAPPILPIQGGLSPVSLDQTRALPNADAIEQKRRINAYMTDHKQQLRFKTVQIPQKESTEEAQSDLVENTPQ